MQSMVSALLVAHIAAGFTALAAGPVAMLSRKGAVLHRNAGKIYFWGMAVVAASAVGLALVKDIVFLLLVAIFSFYMAFTGYRALARKRPADLPAAIDWIASGLMLGAGLFLIVSGLLVPRFGIVHIVFGAIGLAMASLDIRAMLRPDSARSAWLFRHFTRMGGAYIATVTAFSAVNFVFLPDIARWLWPTVVGTPLIFMAASRYQRRLSGGARVSSIVDVRESAAAALNDASHI